MRPPNRRNIVEEEDKALYGESGDGHEEEAEERWRTSRLDPLWERLGPLGERMALVDERFDRLDLEMSHDRGVSKFQHRQNLSARISLQTYLEEIFYVSHGHHFE